MSETNEEARRALTEERGKELDKWWAINFLRFMKFQDPISPTLSDMPTEILVQVLEKLDSIEQLTCRKVCRSLRSTVEKFEIYFAYIWFDVWKDQVTMNLDRSTIWYNDAANGASLVAHNNKETMIKGENFLQVAFRDLGILLKHVREFKFHIIEIDKHIIATFLLNVLKANQFVHVKKISLYYVSLIDAISILPYFDSQMLESICLHCNETNDDFDLICDDTDDDFEQLAQLEQWKNSKDCLISGSSFDNIPVEHLLHFRGIVVDTTLQKMIEIKDKLLVRSTFEECILRLEDSNSIEIAKVFQPHYSGREAFDIEYISNNDKFKIRRMKEDGSIKSVLYIERC